MSPAFVFSDKPVYRISRHVAFWTAFVAFCTLIYGGPPYYKSMALTNYRIVFWDAVSFLPVHAGLSYFIMYFLIPRYLSRGRYFTMLGWVLVGILMSAFLSLIISRTIIQMVRAAYGEPCWSNTFMYGIMAGLRGGITIAGFATSIRLMKLWFIKKVEAEQADKLRAQTELALLKAQIHPHFLFNTLNNIHAYSYQGERVASDMILKLSDMLRYILYECQGTSVPLEGELQLVENYIDLEKVRYGNALDLRVNIRGSANGKRIAPLVLLPFVENSFKHGASRLLDQPWINLDIMILEDVIRLRLVNAKPVGNHSSEGGIGLQNVQRRLEALYADRAPLEIVDAEDSFMVKLEIPTFQS